MGLIAAEVACAKRIQVKDCVKLKALGDPSIHIDEVCIP